MRRMRIDGGTVYDGGGGEPFAADIVLADGVIEAVLPPGGAADAEERIDASGLAVAPGFIDSHSHADWVLPEEEHPGILRPLLLQGVTTSIGGNCGFSPFPVDAATAGEVLEQSRFLTNELFAFHWSDQSGYLEHLDRRGISCNLATLAGHGPMRTAIKGVSPEPMTAAERERLADMLADAFRGGAYGVSLGLSYVPGIFADDAEVETVFRAAAAADVVVAIHGRTYSRVSPCYPVTPGHRPHYLQDLDFFLAMAERTGAKLHVSHVLLKGSETWGIWPEVLQLFDRAADRGIDVTFGVIPYHWGNTLITTLFPKWFLEDFAGNIAVPDRVRRLEKEVADTERTIGRKYSDLFLLWGVTPALSRLEGKSFSDIAEELGVSGIEACLHVAKESGGRAKILTAAYSGEEGVFPEPLERLLAHPLSMVEIDTILTSSSGPQNPASFGALPKWLGRYALECGLVSLAEAVRRITGAPADRFGLRGRGYLRAGCAADVVVFEPAAIRDRNTIRQPTLPPAGIEHVIINGKPQIRRGAFCADGLSGHTLRSNTDHVVRQ